jgi:putative tricarboxylic transport membrane protein
MRLNDTLTGILLLIFGIATVAYAQSFPPSPGQNIGPDLFPSIMGAGLAACGMILVGAGRKQPRTAWITYDEWVGKPRMVFNGLLVIGALIAYALVVDLVGFFVTAFVFLTVLLLAFGVSKRWVPLIAIAVTFGLHLIFYTMLRVPLPWGWFEGIAW